MNYQREAARHGLLPPNFGKNEQLPADRAGDQEFQADRKMKSG
ncbi:hypothetical protein SM11_pC0572 (plasmid) [Sinorhizobium meliloti SM11]|uniref:Uncharacterized protein n=1 Tax=Sinorhizobium meliloti (strain SM11) TaxID=707241 RepID=F7XDM0_SINMM|nr:hypothetical protein SM11_pC0572 [Sinorhizobium meliloti SM11]